MTNDPVATRAAACPVCGADPAFQRADTPGTTDVLAAALRRAFPWDVIRRPDHDARVKDLVHTVNDEGGARCGVVLWSTRRPGAEGDAAREEADGPSTPRPDVVVIVMEEHELPTEIARVGWQRGQLACGLASAPALAAVLRVSLQHLAQPCRHGVSRDEARARLARGLRAPDFIERIDAVVDAFTAMRHQIERDRQAAERQWASRSQRIDTVAFMLSGINAHLHRR